MKKILNIIKYLTNKITKLILFVLICSRSYSQSVPIINSFNPISGTAGSVVTIDGDNFNLDLNLIHVTFGPVKAEVISGSKLQIVVKVPFGSVYGPISILDLGTKLSTRSSQFFTPMFYGDPKKISYENISYNLWGSITRELLLSDFNLDGRVDFYIRHQKIVKNNSINGSLNQNSFEILSTPNGSMCYLGDFNSDGKEDIISEQNIPFLRSLQYFLMPQQYQISNLLIKG